MPKVSQIKIGSVLVKETAPRRWRASWTDPLTKKWIRRVLPVSGFRDAVRQAEIISAELAKGKGFAGRMVTSSGRTSVSIYPIIVTPRASNLDALWR